MSETSCKVCGRTEVTIKTWNADMTACTETRVVPVPDDYPYCYTCHYSGAARAHSSADLLDGIRAVTGTQATIWQTGGGTMSGVVALSSERDDLWAYFGIVHDDGVEMAGTFGLQLWSEQGERYQVTQEEMWGTKLPWVAELEAMWAAACHQTGLDINDLGDFDRVVVWFRLVWDETVRVVFANQHEWDSEDIATAEMETAQ